MRTVLAMVDLTVAGAVWAVQVFVRNGPAPAFGDPAGWALVVVAAVTAVGAIAAQDDYRSWSHVGGPESLARTMRATLVTVAVVLVVADLSGSDLGVAHVVAGGWWMLLGLGVGRWGASIWVAHRRRRGGSTDHSLLVGSGDGAYRFWRHVASRPDAGRVLVGYVASSSGDPGWDLPYLGAVADAPTVASARGLDGIVIAPDALDADGLSLLVHRAHREGLDVELVGGPGLVHPRRLTVTDVAHHPVLYLEPRTAGRIRAAGKRLFDLVVGCTLLAVSGPVMLVAAIATVLDDGRPVFYRQVRVGRDRAAFRLVKFRTMRRGAEDEERVLRDRNERGRGPLFKIADDPRTTRVGRILRATSIDELPQLFNVLAGSMSLVGPRPALVEEEATFDAELQTRCRVKPGITGMWQIEARDNPDFHAYRQLDLFYVENRSFALDVAILTWTVPGLFRHGLTERRRRRSAADPGGAARSRADVHDGDDEVYAVDGGNLAGLGPR